MSHSSIFSGCYTLKGQQQISTETIHDFLQNQGIKMSTVNFKATAILNHTAYFESQGTNVQDNEVIVNNTTIDTFADDGEKILEANFATKETYNLFNYTLEPTETSYETYPVTIRTTKIAGFARTPIFAVHTSLMKLIPTVMPSIDPELYEQTKDHLLDMNYADYFYITAYPEYGGYRIEHNPTVMVYCHLTTNEPLPDEPAPTGGLGVLLLGIGVILIVAFLVVVIRRRK